MSPRSHLALVLAILIALMFWAVPGTAQTPVPSLFVPTPAAAAAAPSQLSSEFDPIEKLRSRSVSYDPAALKNLVNTARDKTDLRYAAAPTVGLNLFEDTFVPLFVESVRPTDDQVGQVISGSVGYARDGHAVITVYEGAMASSVRLSNGEFYQVFVPTNGYGEVEQCRFRGYSHKGTDVLLPEQIEGNGGELFRTPKDANLLQYAKAAGAQSVIDVMVAYTARAREARGGVSGMLAHINQVIAESNQGFANSNVAITFRLVHTVEVDFDDSQSTVSYGSTLLALRKNQDGSMDEVHALRDQYGADLVSLFISPPLPSSGSFTVGMAYILSGDTANPTNLASVANFAPYAFSVVHQSYAGGSSLSFPHEAGHNLGLNHDTANGGAGGGFLKSSVGYQQKSLSPTFFTIMAYSSGCSGCVPLNNFSNPDVSYSGIPTGIAGDLNSESTVNAAATLELVRTAASNWRPTKAGTCSYSLSNTTTSQASSGGSVSVGVVAGSTCSWTAQSNSSWITVASGASGSGNGTVNLSVASNASTSSRTGTVTIAGQTYT
ncbi:MAG: M12 family metallo-peptidase, partial [Bryobacterales bacterium]|nr:M12 family metallo-peptidase [Bryobacterales bacterium]